MTDRLTRRTFLERAACASALLGIAHQSLGDLSAVASAQAEGLRLPLMGSLSRRRLGEGGRASAPPIGKTRRVVRL